MMESIVINFVDNLYSMCVWFIGYNNFIIFVVDERIFGMIKKLF